MDLTEKQLTLWKQLGSNLSAPPHLCQQALNFYSTYKLAETWASERTDLVLRVAYFLAEKAQVLYDREGRRLKSVAISANAVLRDHPKHQEFLYHLRQMLRSISIPPEASHLEEEVSAFSRHLSFALTFLNKLRTTLKKIKVNRKGQEPCDYEQLVTRILWLMFIDCRAQSKIGTDIIESTCLLSCILGYFIVEKYKQQGIFSIYFQHQNQGCTLPNEFEELSVVFMSYFHVKDSNTYFNVYQKLMKYFYGLERNFQTKKLICYNNLQKNIYILQKLYEKKLTDDRLDQSTFLRGNSISNRPARITPFGRRAPLAPKFAPALSHRILTFENMEEGQENKSSLENRKQEKSGTGYFNKLKLQPTPKGTLIRATPMSEAMQLYNWIFQKSGRWPINKEEINAIGETFESCVSNDHTYHSNADHCQLAGGLWKQACQHFPQLNSKGLLLISVYITCHILNAPVCDISLSIQRLQLSVYDVWQALDYIINAFDKTMPLSLKMNLLGLETSFISHRLWKEVSNLKCIQKNITNIGERLTKRVIHQGAYTLHFLSKKLELNEQIEDTSFAIFEQSLQSQSYLLQDRMLEHLLVCSLYAGAKVKQNPVKFNEILGALKQVLGLASSCFDQLVEGVIIDGKQQNIIVFYNIEFVPAIKHFLKHLRSLNGLEASPCMFNSKVRDLVAKEATVMSSPKMANYFAYCESPMLKTRYLRQIGGLSNGVSNTIRRQVSYGLQDIEAKFGRFNGNTLKQTRKIKH